MTSPISTRLSLPSDRPAHGTSTSQSARWSALPLLAARVGAQEDTDDFGLRMKLRLLQLRLQTWQSPFSLRRRLGRGLFLIFAAAFFWLGSATLHAKPSFASSSTVAPIERIMEKTSPSLDKIIDKYVRDHMFDDDTYDPIESLYREAYNDATQGTYHQALREVVGESLGQGVEKSLQKGASKMTIENMFFQAISMLQKRGLSQSTAIVVLASSFAIGAPLAFMLGFAMVSGASKRNMTKLMKSRYGESYTLDATIKPEVIVEAPEDDEDEDDADDDDDGDE